MKENIFSANNFDEFTYSKVAHFDMFFRNSYEHELYGKEIDINNCDLKVYQDLLVYAFFKNNIKQHSKILEIGGGQSRILEKLKNDHECWNLDKLEGLGNGPMEIETESEGIKVVHDYIGNHNSNIPNDYFDVVFSISTLEHVSDDNSNFDNILKDIDRVMKKGAYSLHCIDHATDLLLGVEEEVWTEPVLSFFFDKVDTVNKFIPLKIAERDRDLFVLPEVFYNTHWRPYTGREYKDFGKPFSYNLLWIK